MSGAPVLSVVVLNYNYAAFLHECLESVLAQSFPNFELIVIDDCSTDDSLAVLIPYASDPRVRLVPHDSNQGWVASLIEGTEVHSRGTFLMVISADDYVLDPCAFALQVERLCRDELLVAAFSAFTKVHTGSAREIRRPFGTLETLSGHEALRRLLRDREVSLLHSGAMVRASAYRQAGGYRRGLKNYVDLALWVDLAHLGPFAFIDKPLYAYRIHATQLSGSASGRRAVLSEGLSLLRIEAARASVAGVTISPRGVLRARIADLALADAFGGRRIRALQRCVDAFRSEPVAAITSTGWWLALARSCAHPRAWRALATVNARLRGRASGAAP